MARLRTLKPGFFMNEELGAVDPLGRLLFAGLWCLADRRGRLEDRPARIKVETLPYDKCDVDELLSALAAHGFLIRYSVGPAHYLQIVNFEKHQAPHYKEAESLIPPPDGHVDGEAGVAIVSAEQRQRIMERDGFKCQRCGATDRLAIDHIIPRAKGGNAEDTNLQVLCMSCNSSKNNRIAAASIEEQADIESTSGQVRSDQSGASPSLMGSGLLSLGSSSGNLGVRSGTATERGPGAAARALRSRRKITDEEIQQLATDFAPLMLMGADEVLTRIEAALNHTAVDKAKNEFIYVKNWLRGDVERIKERTNGTYRPNTGRPGEDPAGLDALAKY